jgi:mono/diheme cytochrome c family protein
MRRPFLLLPVAILLAIAAASTPGNLAQQGGKSPAKPPAADNLAKAKKIYAVDCAMCHGDNGNGQTDLAKDMQLQLSDWTDPKSLAGKPDEDLFKVIRDGKDKMPPEDAGRAKDDDVKGLIQYIRGFSKGQATASSTQ